MIDFTWKDVKASDKGILVTSLSPITKASERIERIVIDGRDGDIAISQGFDTYNKTIQIGLTKDFDINYLINWLQGESKIIFSDEYQFYYNARIVNQIDFRRLLRFKTATIIFQVQPYKFLIEENTIDTTSLTFEVENKGYVESKPIMTIHGSGEIAVAINGLQICTLFLDTNDNITIDSILEEAYQGTTAVLRNRSMNGIFPTLESGINTITLTGAVTRTIVIPMSRWL